MNVTFTGLQFTIITQLKVMIPSEETVQKYSPKKTFFSRFCSPATSLKENLLKGDFLGVKKYFSGQLFSTLSLRSSLLLSLVLLYHQELWSQIFFTWISNNLWLIIVAMNKDSRTKQKTAVIVSQNLQERLFV